MTFQSIVPDASALVGQTIDAGRLQLVKILGEGAYGVVYLAVEQLDGSAGSSSKASPREFAVKVLAKVDSRSTVGKCQSREIVAHKIASDHPGVLTLHDVIEDDRFIFIVLDYCPGGDLYSMVVERQAFCQSDALIKSVLVQILDAVQSCHDKGIYHRDLKPDNIFVGADCSSVYLGDFGLATDRAVSSNFGYGSLRYMSPGTWQIIWDHQLSLTQLIELECIGEEHNFTPYSSEASDIWSLGVIYVNIVTGRNPWRKATTYDEHFHRYISDPDKFIENLLPMSQSASELLKRVLAFSPISRISLEEFKEAVLAIDTFFPSSKEADSAKMRDKRVYDARAHVTTLAIGQPNPATPTLPQAVAEDPSSMYAYPDEGYIFASPDPDTFDIGQSSTPSTSSTVLSPTSTFCDDDVDVSAIECTHKLSERILAERAHHMPNHTSKPTNDHMNAAMRLMERLIV